MNFKGTIEVLCDFSKDRLETMKHMDMSYKGGREHLDNTTKLIKEIGMAIEILKKR